jgi:hypothetical protein
MSENADDEIGRLRAENERLKLFDRSENHKLRARVAELEEALRPFAGPHYEYGGVFQPSVLAVAYKALAKANETDSK